MPSAFGPTGRDGKMSATAIWPSGWPSITTGTDCPSEKTAREPVASWPWVGVDLDLAMDQVDDPVDRDPGRAVDLGRHPAILRQAGVGDLDDQGDVVRTGMPVLVVADRPPHDATIGLGLAGLTGEPDRLGRWDVVPVGGDDPGQLRAAQFIRDPVGGILGHLGHQVPVDEMEPVPLGEAARGHHGLVLLHRHPVER